MSTDGLALRTPPAIDVRWRRGARKSPFYEQTGPPGRFYLLLRGGKTPEIVAAARAIQATTSSMAATFRQIRSGGPVPASSPGTPIASEKEGSIAGVLEPTWDAAQTETVVNGRNNGTRRVTRREGRVLGTRSCFLGISRLPFLFEKRQERVAGLAIRRTARNRHNLLPSDRVRRTTDCTTYDGRCLERMFEKSLRRRPLLMLGKRHEFSCPYPAFGRVSLYRGSIQCHPFFSSRVFLSPFSASSWAKKKKREIKRKESN